MELNIQRRSRTVSFQLSVLVAGKDSLCREQKVAAAYSERSTQHVAAAGGPAEGQAHELPHLLCLLRMLHVSRVGPAEDMLRVRHCWQGRSSGFVRTSRHL